MRILFVTSEIYPYVKTGGLADVSAALPVALARKGADIRLMLPGYPQVMKALQRPRRLARLPSFFGATNVEVLIGALPGGISAYVLYAPEWYERSGTYVDRHGRDWKDNHLRFAGFSHIAAHIDLHDANWTPDIIHGNDWQCGLIPAYLSLRSGPQAASVMTVHNLAYQGLFPRGTLAELRLPPDMFSINGVEYYGQVGFLKAGLFYADSVTTVSPTYAREITTADYGCGLEGLLDSRSARLTGILNGIDHEQWDPEKDRAIPQCYSARTLDKKQENKKSLIAEMGLPAQAPDYPLFAVISRLTDQKGLDLLIEAGPALFREGLRLVILGTGDRELEKSLASLASVYPGHLAIRLGYDEALAHRIQAGADAVIVPSRFEPCGLVQLYGLRYGTLPVVRNTGGLADSVTDAGTEIIQTNATGFIFGLPTTPALAETLKRAMAVYRQPTRWRAMQRNAMAQDFSWDGAAEKYLEIYSSLRPEAVRSVRSPLPLPSAKAGSHENFSETAF